MLIYPDRRRAALAPAYDFVATTPNIKDETSALKFSRTARFDRLTKDELAHLADRAFELPISFRIFGLIQSQNS